MGQNSVEHQCIFNRTSICDC